MVLVAVFGALSIVCARPASAQWYAAASLGANRTMPATVSISQPSRQTALEFHDVRFGARPFESPQYYSLRGGRLFGERRRFGVEFEWLHPKVYADVARAVHVTGRIAGASLDSTLPMNAIVQRYAMSHGMNFILASFVTRIPLGEDAASSEPSRFALIGRAGAGPMLPHGETTVIRESVDQYDWAGAGVQLAGGIDVRLAGRLSGTLEYRFGHARPEIAVADGTGRVSVNMHQVAFGVAFGLTR
jgi:hypothetical protein